MPMRKRNFRSVYTKPTLLSYEQSRRHSLGSSWVHSECARYASSLSLRLVWKRCPGRGSAANAKNASTPPLDTDNIGFEPPTRIGNSTWIVRIAFSQTPFPQTVNSPQDKIAREPSSCRQLRDNGKGGIFCFPQFCYGARCLCIFPVPPTVRSTDEPCRDPHLAPRECHLDTSRKRCDMTYR